MDSESLQSRVSDQLDADRDRVAAEIDGIKDSFAQLKHDMVELFSRAFGLGRAGADVAKDQAADAVENLKHRLADLKEAGSDRLANVSKKIEQNPVQAALIAFGVGFLLAKLMGGRK
jgi:ElaB/YqjD/DUF883 family membrane-anchored ribosome-binding protein